jgi:signal transduction histidine kinase
LDVIGPRPKGFSINSFSLQKRLVWCSAFAVALMLFGRPVTFAAAAQEGRAKRVLVISTGSRFSVGFPIVEQNAVDKLRQLYPAELEFYSEYLDIVRFPSDSYHRVFRDYLRDKYAGDVPDLIVLIYVGNLGVAEKLLEQLFPNTPVVTAGLTEEEFPAGLRSAHFAGIAQRSDPGGTIDLLRRLQPEIQRVVLIGGSAEVDRQVMRRAKQALSSFAGEVEVWDQRSIQEILKAVTSLPPKTAILFTRMFRDGAGRATISSQAAQSIARVSNVPVYVMTDNMIGTGAVGGSVADIAALGQRAGELANQIFNGAEPRSIPLEILTQGVPILDWRALKRWGMSESRLPPNSLVRFRPQSMWEQYRGYIVGALIIFGIQAAMIVALLAQRARRRGAETELRRNREELAHLTRITTLGELATSLAHEVNQPLTAILSNAQAAQRFLSKETADIEEVHEILRDIVQDSNRAGDVIRRMRALVKKEELAFSSLDLATLIREIVLLAHGDAALRNVRVLVDVRPDLPQVRGDRTQLQQVLLNLLLNAFDAMKDCPADEREVLLRTEPDGAGLIRTSVSDLGTGVTSDKLDRIFQPFFSTKREGLGVGLSISRTIIEAHGGKIWAENNNGRGATFCFTVPIEESGERSVNSDQ